MCDLELQEGALRPCDPCGRQFALRRLLAELLPIVGELVGLAVWWGVDLGLPGDGVVLVVWDVMSCLVSGVRRAYR